MRAEYDRVISVGMDIHLVENTVEKAVETGKTGANGVNVTPQNLYDELISGLQVRKGAWRGLARDVGVSHSWLAKVYEGSIANPGVLHVQRVVDWLRTHPVAAKDS
ncbi:MAG: hypothetical protein ACYCOU_01360 [Sulfobacillus sp.]